MTASGAHKTGRHPGVYIGLYCSTTITLLFFNKWLFTQIPEFRFVLMITCIQQFGVAAIIFLLRPFMSPIIGHVGMSWTLFRRISPVGIIAAIDYAFSNLALQALPMTIYEIVKSCAPAVVLSLSIVLGLTQPSIKLTAVVVVIVSGAIIGVYRPGGGVGHGGGASEITTIGLFYICMAALSAAAKSVAAQITLQGDKSKLPKRRGRGGASSATRASQLALGASASASCNPSLTGTPLTATCGGDAAGAEQNLALSERDSLHPSRETSFYGGTTTCSQTNGGTPRGSKGEGRGADPSRSSSRRISNKHARTGSMAASLGTCAYDGLAPEDRHMYDLYGPTNPATVACVCSAVTVITVLPFAMLREHVGLAAWAERTTLLEAGHIVGLIFLGSTLSVVANICSFFVMREASALTYALVAVCQRGLTVIAAVLFLHEEMPPWAIGGFSLTMCGIVFYNRMSSHGHHQHQIQHQQEKEREEKEASAIHLPPDLVGSDEATADEAQKRSGGALSSIVGVVEGDHRRRSGRYPYSRASLSFGGASGMEQRRGVDSCCSRDRRERRLRYTMAAVSGDAMYLAALESHSDSSSSSDDDDYDSASAYSKSSSDADDEELKGRVRRGVVE